MIQFFFKSPYRPALICLALGLFALWYFWFKTDQIISSSLIIYTTGVVVLNTFLAYFAADRHHYVTRSLFLFSGIILILALYTLYSVSRGIL
jgi:hypothetical protein